MVTGCRGEGGAAPVCRGLRHLTGVFLALALAVPLAGTAIVRWQEPRIEAEAVQDLTGIADLKGAQIEAWLTEWAADAEVLVSAYGFMEHVDLWHRRGDPEARDKFANRLNALRRAHHFEIHLVDADGRPMPGEEARARVRPAVSAAALRAALDQGQVQGTGLYRDETGRLRLDYLVPLVLPESGGPRPVGVAVIGAPIARTLEPLLESWPSMSHRGQARLVPGTAAAGTVDAGAGVAVTRQIRGLGWSLALTLDRDEVLTPLRTLTRWVMLLALLAVGVVGAAVIVLWRQQQHANRLELVAQAAEKDKLLNLFYELPFSGMALTSPDSRRFLYVNDRLCDMLGYPREELVTLSWDRLTHPDDLSRNVAEVEQMLTGRSESCRLEKRYRRRDGGFVLADVHSRCTRHADGRVDLVVSMIQDITERRRAEEHTRQVATVFESTRDGVMIAGLDGCVLAVNKAFTRISGHEEAEVLGHNPRMLQSGRHEPAFYEAMWHDILDQGQWQGEIWNRRKNGELYPAWMTITTVRDAQERPNHYVCVFTDISQIKRSEEQLAHLAHYDPLTDLPNRLLLQSRLAHALDRAERHGHRVAVLFIDLDHFKTVNDSLGHMAGDGLLVKAADRLRAGVRDEDTLGRLGGDEFLLVLERLGEPQEAAIVASHLLAGLAVPVHLASGHEVCVGASVGISVYPEDGRTTSELLRGADAAMYRAKDQGRNRFCFYTADMNASAVMQLELEASLRRALERGEFELHYQPKVDLATGRICGAEGLIRWRREDGRLEAPGLFIPLAERTGLIAPIGTWVIAEACRRLRAWRDAGQDELCLAVNVSAVQFRSCDLVATVAAALQDHGVPAAALELELTESMLMDDPERTVATLDALKRIGVRISLDDFGTGYSSFAYLSRFPIDTLKIDQSFVQNVVTEPQAAMIAVSIIDLAHRLSLRVVAEGVETAAQLGYLGRKGCDEIQGFHFARPVPEQDFSRMLHEGKCLPPAAGADGAAPLRTLLAVDDEPHILTALTRILEREGYRVLTASSAREGLDILATEPVQVVLSDQRMPEMLGTEFLGRVKELHPGTVRMVLSGFADLETVTRAINDGAIYKFLHKPWNTAELRRHLRDAFLHQEAQGRSRLPPLVQDQRAV